jgi:AraC-like DNA-binding protein
MVVTSLPRGTLQISQPQRLPEQILRAFSREFNSRDRLTWRAIDRKRAVRGTECWGKGEFETSRYRTEFMEPNGLKYALAVPLSAPVFAGYPGALHVYRSADQGAFNEHEMSALMNFATKLDTAVAKARAGRRHTKSVITESAKRTAPLRQFIFDSQLKPLSVSEDPAVLDERVRQQMIQLARQRFGHLNGDEVAGDRVSLPDSNGDVWNFRAVVHRTYPALGEGPFIFFCQTPGLDDWTSLRATDFQADAELSRLVPALRFMEQEFHRGPTLTEIAKQVHLSPFHFHRRFTELLGITPKHFMLDCQIDQAKRDLLAREKDLADIAKECGFAHQSHFTSRFKQATGLTPTRWRRMALDLTKNSRN